ncbi:MAG TPA: c-type cytochrome [Candidatus Eisenbacteria bacterium]|nr:c-type cytochrome [Candidatus Eisenbacteria bacterium]
MRNRSILGILGLLATAAACAAAAGNWLRNVPESYRNKTNPFAHQSDAIAAGGKLYEYHCASCHGDDASGKGKRPSLRSHRVQNATDGELFWLLRNGNLAKGMPTWAGIPEPMRWQIVAYIKSLGAGSEAAGKTSTGGGKR